MLQNILWIIHIQSIKRKKILAWRFKTSIVTIKKNDNEI